jgi:hypothetical protein
MSNPQLTPLAESARAFTFAPKGTQVPADLAICPGCRGTGWQPSPDNPDCVRHCEACDYWDLKRGQPPGLPMEEEASRISNFENPDLHADALLHAHYFLEGIHPGLYIYGGSHPENKAGTGTGKTRLACSILNELWAKKTHVRFLRVQDLLNHLVPGQEEDGETAKWMRLASTATVAVFDDIGNNQASDFARRQLLAIFEARMDYGLRTIWTSNLSLDELKEFFGDDRLPSRIAGNAKVVKMVGPDFRLKKAERRARQVRRRVADRRDSLDLGLADDAD